MRTFYTILISFILLFSLESLSQSSSFNSLHFEGTAIIDQSNYTLTNDGSNEFNPISRINIFNSFYMDWKEFIEDRFYNVSGIAAGYLFSDINNYTSFQVPFIITDLTFKTTSGFGDLLIDSYQIVQIDKTLSSILGVEAILPTATRDETGFGKFIISPVVGLSCNTSYGFLGIIIKEYITIGGDADRQKVSETALQPIARISLGNSWYTRIEPDVRYNWTTKRIFIPYTQEFGKMFNRNFVLSFKGGGHIINRDRRYDWNAEIKFSYLFQ